MKKACRLEDIYPVKDSYMWFDRRDTAFEMKYRKTGSLTCALEL